MSRYTYVCASCGSKKVWSDANATWNEVTQQWELLNTFDNCYCEDCEGETTLETKELP